MVHAIDLIDLDGTGRPEILAASNLGVTAILNSYGRRALGEMRVNLDAAHIAEVEAKLAEAERASKPKP